MYTEAMHKVEKVTWPQRFRHCIYSLCCVLFLPLTQVTANELEVGKVCPVKFQEQNLGIIVISKPWFHASRLTAAYQAMDDATGIGVEIHFFANESGDTRFGNAAACDRYRFLQVRQTNAKLFAGERPLQVDIPMDINQPFYDTDPLEYGRGTHQTPEDDADKPWQGRPSRASTVAIYDTPYVSDGYGVEGQDMWVRFETCAVCEREQTADSLLSCVSWGYERDYMGGATGWSEPETLPLQCIGRATHTMQQAINNTDNLTYLYGQDWY